MSDNPESPDPRAASRSGPQGPQTEAWKRTLEEMNDIAADRQNDGWSVVTVIAGHTDAVSRSMGDDDRFGLVHAVPANYADEFVEAYDSDEFTEYLAYGRNVGPSKFLVTELIDPDRDRSILIASRYDTSRADGMVASAEDEGVLYTHLKRIDGTMLGSFAHEEYEPLLPDRG